MPGAEERAGKETGSKPASWSFRSSGEDRPGIVQMTQAEHRSVEVGRGGGQCRVTGARA